MDSAMCFRQRDLTRALQWNDDDALLASHRWSPLMARPALGFAPFLV